MQRWLHGGRKSLFAYESISYKCFNGIRLIFNELQLFVQTAVRMAADVLHLKHACVQEDLPELSVKMTWTSVRWGWTCTNAELMLNVLTNQDGKIFSHFGCRWIDILYILRHYCECKTGYRAYQDPERDGDTVCVDEDECELGLDTCHPSSKCWNTPGSYQCYCGNLDQSECSRGLTILSPLM